LSLQTQLRSFILWWD